MKSLRISAVLVFLGLLLASAQCRVSKSKSAKAKEKVPESLQYESELLFSQAEDAKNRGNHLLAERKFIEAAKIGPGNKQAVEKGLLALTERVAQLRSADIQSKTEFKDPDFPEDLRLAHEIVSNFLALTRKDKKSSTSSNGLEHLCDRFVDFGHHMEGNDRPLCAQKTYELSLLIDPSHSNSIASLYKVREFLCDWKDREKSLDKILGIVQNQFVVAAQSGTPIRSSLQPLTSVSQNVGALMEKKIAMSWASWYEYYFEMQLRNQKRKVDFQASASSLLSASFHRKNAAIRVGYISSDFRRHAVAWLSLSVFLGHKKRHQIETYIYSTNPRGNNNEFADSIREASTVFVEAQLLSDVDLAQKINLDKIHIIVEMNAHSGSTRIGSISKRPAPASAFFIGYPSTTGASYIDYFITDSIASPPDYKDFFTESLAYMQGTYYPSNPLFKISKPPTRESMGLPASSSVTFISFNRNLKIKPNTFRRWLAILKAVPNSVLWLRKFHSRIQENLLQYAAKMKVNSSRIVFAGIQHDKSQHLARHLLGDLFLDTFHFNAHSTAADALFASLPVLTAPGDTLASRICSSMVMALRPGRESGGFGNMFIARNEDDYEALGIALGKKGPRWWRRIFRVLRSAKEEKWGSFNVEKYISSLERLYRMMIEVALASPNSKTPQLIELNE